MAKYLVIVESPAKSKTIEKYLGDEYTVTSSKGHIRDLTTRGYGGFGVDIENGFEPMYKIMKDKKETVKELKALVKKADKVYLATDPDREGEAISWHLYETLNLVKKDYERIVFHEITKNAVLNAIDNGRSIDMDLVHSQEARRIIDRIIGFSLSKLLQKKIGSKSAGRVQSVALKLIVDREKEIDAFNSKEYWEMYLNFVKKNKKLKALLLKENDENVKLESKADCEKIEKGRMVKVVRGRKVPIGAIGVVFWMGEVNYDPYKRWGNATKRVGFKADDGETYWTDARNVEVLDPTNYYEDDRIIEEVNKQIEWEGDLA